MTEREFEKCVNKYTRLLWSVAAPVLEGIGSEQDVEECVADVFIELWQRPEAYDPSRGSLKNWLCIKCKSRAIDAFRRLSAHISEELSEETLRSMAQLAEEDVSELREKRLAAVRAAVVRLDEPAREIMLRRFCLGQKPSQIAAAMDLNVRKVENVIYRTKQKLKEALADGAERDAEGEREKERAAEGSRKKERPAENSKEKEGGYEI